MNISQRFFSRPRLVGLLGGLTLAVAQFFTPAGLGTAQAAPVCTTTGNQVTCTFDYSGAAESWTVPTSVTSVTVDLYGGKGGDGLSAVGGKGAYVHAVLPVTSGETLVIVVASQGGNGQAFGGGGGSSNRPGVRTLNGGGGASSVERNGARLLVAGGGGGAAVHGGVGGGDSANPGVTYSDFGAGPWDGRGGGAGAASVGGVGGAGGSGSAFGSCSTWIDGTAGGDGSFSQGGNGGGDSGGGGGGGYYGGGGGGMPGECTSRGVTGRPGGGGGGSSYIDASATQGAITEGVQNGHGQVVLSYSVTDNSAPSASPTQSPAANAAGWNNTAVTVDWNWSDNVGGMGIDPVNCTLSSTTTGEGELTLTATCSDLAGNQGNASYTVKVDTIAPSVMISGVENGAGYPLGSVPVATCNSSDDGSGIATLATLSITGGNPDGTGSFTATCSGAVDNAGNTGSASASYFVAYNWSGFFQPVDNLPISNTTTAGSAIPVKFSLGGDYGLNIFASGYPKVQTIACATSSTGGSGRDEIEETVTAGSTALKYDATTQVYTYIWKTDKAWAGTCRQLIVKLIDGSEHIAFFQFNGKRK